MERRIDHRWDVDALAHCRVPATPLAAKLLNISKTGCRVHAQRDHIAAKGATILLQLSPTLAAAGQIAWLRGKDFGVKFYRPLSDDDVASVVTEEIVIAAEATP